MATALLAADSRFPILPPHLVQQIRDIMPDDGIVCLDNGVYFAPSQFETFDPKDDGPAHARSLTGRIATSIPGVSFGGTFEKLAKRAHLTLKDLADETFILYRRPDGRGLYDVIIAACSEAGFSPHVGQEAPRIVSTLNLVAAGLGITIVPASLSRLPLEGVTYKPLKGKPALKVPLNLACRRDERSAATLGFIDLVRRLPS